MGCCASSPHKQDEEDEIENSEDNPSTSKSFTDLSMVSSFEKVPSGQVMQTEDLNQSRTSRLRSTSCNSFQFSNQLETAFLFGTPLNSDRESPCKRSGNVNYCSFHECN